MEKTLRKLGIKLSRETAFIILTLIGAVLLPQLVHAAGLWLGVGDSLGKILLPMYLPIFIIGFYRGPIPGLVTGILAPMVSFLITGMPKTSVLPYLMLELVAIGVLSGLLAQDRRPVVLRVLLVQVGAKVIRILAFLINAYAATGGVQALGAQLGEVARSLPGILLQLVIISCLLWKRDRGCDER